MLLPLAVEASKVYRWTDANGTVHISDTPPKSPGTTKETIVLPTSPQSSAPAERGIRPGETQLLEDFDRQNKAEAEADKAREAREAEEEDKAETKRLAKCRDYTRLYDSISTDAKARVAARAGDRRLNNKKYLRAKRKEYRDKMDKYCD